MTDRLSNLLKLYQEMPGDEFITYGIALEYASQGDDETALDYFTKLKSSNPGYLPLYYQLGKLYERSGRNKDAIETYDAGMMLAKNQKDMHTYSELQSAQDDLY
jgi:tetratricopeptide (TPR) repeat protein